METVSILCIQLKYNLANYPNKTSSHSHSDLPRIQRLSQEEFENGSRSDQYMCIHMCRHWPRSSIRCTQFISPPKAKLVLSTLLDWTKRCDFILCAVSLWIHLLHVPDNAAGFTGVLHALACLLWGLWIRYVCGCCPDGNH